MTTGSVAISRYKKTTEKNDETRRRKIINSPSGVVGEAVRSPAAYKNRNSPMFWILGKMVRSRALRSNPVINIPGGAPNLSRPILSCRIR